MPPIANYRDTVRQTLIEELDRDDNVFLIGEDIGRYQGTFRVTQGLFDKYGARRVIDTPITEPGIVGIAAGAAMTGLRPVVEMMTMSFSILAMDQIINHAAKIHYMTGGQAKVPLVIRGPGGAANQLSAQHSHSVEGWYAHVPGLKVVAPATPACAKGLLKSAIRDDNPVIFTENPGLYAVKGEVPDDPDFIIPFGSARIAKEGKDISLSPTAAWSTFLWLLQRNWQKMASTPKWSTYAVFCRWIRKRFSTRFAKHTERWWFTKTGRAAALALR